LSKLGAVLPPSLRKTVPMAMFTCLLVVVGHFGGESSQADDTELNLIAAPSYATHTQLVASQPVSGYGATPEAIPAPMWPVDYRLDVGSTKIILTEITGLRPFTPPSAPASFRHKQTTRDQSLRIRKTPVVRAGRRCVAVPYLRR
jgi:hypothetical protein